MSTQGKIDRQDIYRDVAERVDLTPEEVKEAVRYQFKYVAQIMAEGNFEPVRLPYFGIFKAKKKRLKHMNATSSS